jgi:hypothetical protein
MKDLSKKINPEFEKKIFEDLVKILRKNVGINEKTEITRNSDFRIDLRMGEQEIGYFNEVIKQDLGITIVRRLNRIKTTVGDYMDYIAEEEIFNMR